MGNKQLDKNGLDKVLRYTRSYWGHKSTDTEAVLDARIFVAEQIVGGSWLALIELADGILGAHGFCKNASNEKVYDVFRLLGWEIVETVEEDNAERT